VHTLDNLFWEPDSTSKIENLVAKQGQIKRLKYVARGKRSLERVIEQLGRWNRQFDPSWILLSRISLPVIQEQLAKKEQSGVKSITPIRELREAHEKSKIPSHDSSTSIFLDENYTITDIEEIPLTTASTGLAPNGMVVIIDKHTIRENAEFKAIKKDIRDLATILSKADPAFSSLLPCQGVIVAKDQAYFRIIFSIPEELTFDRPCSLRSLLVATEAYSLNERLHIGTSLARSVVFLHASRIVHKSISPENIIILPSAAGALETPLLVGFERFRFNEQRTNMAGDNLWEKNLYRHPARQGLHPEEIYDMRHDIYSTGVCLLELGLGSSFVNYSDDQKIPSARLPIADMLAAKNKRKAAVEIKSVLINLAKSYLPQQMGRIYTDTVIACLTCLDPSSPLFKDESEFEDEDGILVGVRYIEKVSSL
jgi:Protein kinase domain.